MIKIAKEHPIYRIAAKPLDYKYCNDCGKINWYENHHCKNCNGRKFNQMKREDADDLIDNWADQQEYLMEV